jgi:hypothetical protein
VGIRKTSRITKTIKVTIITILVTIGVASFAARAADVNSQEARTIAKKAYIYGYPMVDAYRAMYAYAVDKAGPAYRGTFNQVINEARLYTPQDRTILAPNSDTVYGYIMFDLRTEPLVITLPAIEPERYYSVQLIDSYTFNFDYLGSRRTGNGGGNYLLAGPGWKGDTPKSIAKVIASETYLGSAAFRTQLFGLSDLENVKKVQAGYKVQPLSVFLGRPAPKRAPEIEWLKPLSDTAQRTSLEFFNILRFVLEFCPVHPSEKGLRERFTKIGIVPGKPLDVASLSPETKEATAAGMADGQKAIDERRLEAKSAADLFGTREYLKNDYLARAVGAQVGIFANSKEEAFYTGYGYDAEGQPLDARQHHYRVHFSPGQLPPARAFWSLTMYDLPGLFLVANPINRYLINSPMLPDLKRDADGGLTLTIQHESPGKEKESNWLPAPNGPFNIYVRIYWPKPEVLDGTWKLPPMERMK